MNKNEKRYTLRDLRKKARLSQLEVEEKSAIEQKCRIPQSTLSDWENGKKDPTAKNMLVLAALYKVSHQQILEASEYTKSCKKK